MRTHEVPAGRGAHGPGGRARTLALMAIAVLLAGVVLLGSAWTVGGEEAISDTWIGATSAVALLAGVAGSMVAAVLGLVDLARTGSPPRSRLALLTFPTVVVVLLLLELLVLE